MVKTTQCNMGILNQNRRSTNRDCLLKSSYHKKKCKSNMKKRYSFSSHENPPSPFASVNLVVNTTTNISRHIQNNHKFPTTMFKIRSPVKINTARVTQDNEKFPGPLCKNTSPIHTNISRVFTQENEKFKKPVLRSTSPVKINTARVTQENDKFPTHNTISVHTNTTRIYQFAQENEKFKTPVFRKTSPVKINTARVTQENDKFPTHNTISVHTNTTRLSQFAQENEKFRTPMFGKTSPVKINTSRVSQENEKFPTSVFKNISPVRTNTEKLSHFAQENAKIPTSVLKKTSPVQINTATTSRRSRLIQRNENVLSSVYQRPRSLDLYKNVHMSWNKYQRLNVIYDFMDDLQEKYPSICSSSIIGSSVEGRDIKILKISNNKVKNCGVWLDAGIHAREWIGPAVNTFVANHIAKHFNSLPKSCQNKDWYFVPVANPDGYEYTHTTNRLWRKNRGAYINGECCGVDLNRNFSHGWGGEGSSDNPKHNFYRGTEPFSEPESCAIRAIFETFGNTYKVGLSMDLMYRADGTSNDWSHSIGIPFCYLIELRSRKHKFNVPSDEIKETGTEILNCLISLMEFVDELNFQQIQHKEHRHGFSWRQ